MNFGVLTSRSHAIAKAAGAVLILIALAAWALASPVGASPDEDFHLTSVWCGHGLRDGGCEVGTDPATRTVPSALLEAPCYAFNADVSGACQGTSFADSDVEMALTSLGNFTGDYPPVFYFFMSLFVGDDIPFSVVAMRLANALLFVGLIAATYLASPPGLRRPLLGGIAVTVVPLGMFILPSINPSSWALVSAATFLVSVLGYMTSENRVRRLVLGALAGISLLVGAGARADAAMYAVLAVVVALILAVRSGRHHLRRAIYPVILAIIAGLAYLSTGQSSALEETSAQTFSLGRLARVLIGVPDLWVGALGKWGLGWLDTIMPPVVWVAAFGVFVATLCVAMNGAGVRRALGLGVVALAAWMVPAYVQYLSGAPVGAYVQPRYILPLLTLLAVTAMVRLEGTAFRLTHTQRWVPVLALSAANAVALYVNLRRYVTGFDVDSLNLNAQVEWWWGGPVSPLALWIAGSLAFALGLVLLSSEMTSVAAAGEEPEPRGPDAGAEGDGAKAVDASSAATHPQEPRASLPNGDAGDPPHGGVR